MNFARIGYISFGLVSLLWACGGAKADVRQAGGVPANAPEWVNRGSRVEAGSIFGVGSVSGIKNTPLARDTAANRGRAEISRILEVYSASLMKDYQESVSAGASGASSEGQMVQQAIKTFSANLVNGTEVRDMWLSPTQGPGTWYALVELNFARAREAAAAQAQMSPGLRAWVDENGPKVLADLEDAGPKGTAHAGDNDGSGARDGVSGSDGQSSAASPVPVAEAPREPAVPAKVGGPAPAWTQGRCDRERYLCGVGDGGDRKIADNDARAELARIFKSNIQAVTKSFEGAASQISKKTGESWIEVQKVSAFSMVSTDKVVTMSEILERWDDGKGRLWSLAVIDRARAGGALRDQIEQKDGLIASMLSKAEEAGSDNLKKLKALKAAVIAHVEREALNSDLRVIDAKGKGIPAPHEINEMLGMLGDAAAALRFGLAISGSGAERVRDCLEQALTERGYQIEANVDEDSEDDLDISGSFDVIVRGKVKNESRGEIAGKHVVQTTLTLKLINAETSKVLRTITGSEKGTRPTIKAAASTSAFKICQQKVPSMIADIDRFFGK
ncbi:MAG: LPP20 family lipoprotein [Deltaproteobacteria bacterium]|nr:LPP20 family lipoprotein [Deltaproteobacteria bacterium]